eukprot:751909-Hanusia_phi.AAC.2
MSVFPVVVPVRSLPLVPTLFAPARWLFLNQVSTLYLHAKLEANIIEYHSPGKRRCNHRRSRKVSHPRDDGGLVMCKAPSM